MQKSLDLQKKVQIKIVKKLLDFVILQLLNEQPMHGYELITTIRKSFGVHFGPSTVYPLLANLEKNNYIASKWLTENDRPRKIYTLTSDGQDMLFFIEKALNQVCQKMDSVFDTDTEKNLSTEPKTSTQ